MTFLRPEAAWLLLAALPLIVLHLRRQRRRVVGVGSVHLWRDLAGSGVGRAGFRRVREAGALALLLLALALLTASLADPVTGAAALRPSSLVIVLDGSVTMNTRDGETTRFERARAAVARGLRGKVAGDDVTVWLADGSPYVLAGPTTSARDAEAALAGATPTLEVRSLARALDLARRALDLRDAVATVLVITDAPGAETLAARGDLADVVIGAVGRGDVSNASVLGVTQTHNGVRVRLVTRDGEPGERLLRVTLNGDVVAEVPAILTAGGESTLDVFVPELADGRLEARLTPPDDFPDDDAGGLIVRSAPALRVVLTAPGGRPAPYLLEALRSMPLLVDAEAALLASPAADPGVFAAVDVVIAEERVPNALPAGLPLLAFAPTDTIVDRPLLWGVGAHPVLEGVDLTPLRLDKASVLSVRAGETVLIESADGPLAVAGERDGARHVRLGFRADATTLPLEPAFPLLVRNALVWLRGSTQVPPSAVAGEPVRLRGMVPEAVDRVVLSLSGLSRTVRLGPDRADPPAPLPLPGAERVLRIGLPGGASLGETMVSWRLPSGTTLRGSGEAGLSADAAIAALPAPPPPPAPLRRLAPLLAGLAALFLFAGAFLLSARAPGAHTGSAASPRSGPPLGTTTGSAIA